MRHALGPLIALSLLAATPALADPIPDRLAWPAIPASGVQPAARPTPCPSGCIVSARSAARPSTLLAGETTEVTLHLRATCFEYPSPLHLVLAVDSASGIERKHMETLKAQLHTLIKRLDLPNNPERQIALVESSVDHHIPLPILDRGGQARTLQHLSNEPVALERATDRLQALRAIEETNPLVEASLREAHRELRRGRVPDCRGVLPIINEIVILISTGPEHKACSPAQKAARQLKSDGILLIAVCAGPECKAGCMREVASSARYFYQLENFGGIIQIFERIRDERIATTLRQLEVVEPLAAGIDYLPGSARPPLADEADARRLRWQQSFIPRDGITLTYQARPRRLGQQALSEGTRLSWRDTRNQAGSLHLPPTWTQVFAPATVSP